MSDRKVFDAATVLRQCGTDAWPTAGSVAMRVSSFEGTRKPLRLWFQAKQRDQPKRQCARPATHSWPGQLSVPPPGLAAQVAARPISWAEGEVDETYVGGRETGVVGRQTNTKSIVAMRRKSEGGAPRRGCGCEEPDPVCPNNRGAWRDRPNRWRQRTVVWRTKAMTTSRDPFPPVATRPTSSCHESRGRSA